MTLNIGDPAPDFTLNDVTSGTSYKLSSFAGTPMLLVFAGLSWCPHCQFEAPVLQDLWEDISNEPCLQKPQFLMVSYSEEANQFKQAVASFSLTFPALYDPNGAVAGQYGIYGVPTAYVISADLKVCNVIVGAVTPASALYEQLSTAMSACGACNPLIIDASRYLAFIRILFGVTNDAPGLGLTPGGKPVPIDPWGPLVQLSAPKRNIVASLAISELTKSLRDPTAAREIEALAARSLERSTKKLVARATRKTVPTEGLFSTRSARK